MKQHSKALKQRITRALDRRGARWLLAAASTWYARRATQKNVAIFYDEFWIHRVGERYLADSLTFNYFRSDIRLWGTSQEAYVNDAADYWFWRYTPNAGDVIIDIGAGVGTDVCAFSREVGPTGRVIALEAHPKTFLGLVKTCQWNRLNNVVCEQVAVMDKVGALDLQDGDDDKANATAGDNGDRVRVSSVTLDDVCEKYEIEHIDFLKINIEGAERWALAGMERSLQITRFIAVACHDFRAQRGDGDRFATLNFVKDFLEGRGFYLETRVGDARPYIRDHVHGRRELTFRDSSSLARKVPAP